MRKSIQSISVILLIVISTITLTSCFGNFQLTRNLYNWNGSIGDKFANTAVMWVMFIIPVYEVCGFIDLFLLNVIQFWSGENPLTMAVDEVDIKIVESGNNIYEVKASQNRFDIFQIAGENAGKSLGIVYDPLIRSWHLEAEGEIITIAELNGGILNLYYPDGTVYQANLRLD